MSPMAGQQRVAAVILAAGASSRFGSPKPLAPFAGGAMLEAVVDVARGAGLDPILVVAPTELPLPDGVIRVANDRPAAGLSRSLRLGLAAVPPGCPAMLLLGDQPTVSADHLRRLIDARGSAGAVATEAEGLVAPPVLLEPAMFGLADAATGDRGLRELLRGGAVQVATVRLARHPPDVDEPADLDALTTEILD